MRGWIEVSYQRYECLRCATFWSDTPDRPFGEYTVEVVEFIVFAYLRTLSLNVGVTLLRAFYEQDILSKWQVLEFIERVADMLPSMEAVTAYFKPLRSGWYAWDGTWFKYRGHDFVLLGACRRITPSFQKWDRERKNLPFLLPESLSNGEKHD